MPQMNTFRTLTAQDSLSQRLSGYANLRVSLGRDSQSVYTDCMQTKTLLLIGLFLQYCLFAGVVLSNDVIASKLVYTGIEFVGLFFMVWSSYYLNLGLFRITPGKKLITDGPFRYIRHPVSFGMILICGALLLDTPSPLNALLVAVFIGVTLVQITKEESLLSKQFASYRNYMEKSFRLIPFLY